MLWVKLQVSLRHNPMFRRLSDRAKVAFWAALLAAADYEQEGALVMRQGFLTQDELAHDLMLTRRQMDDAVRELLAAGFFCKREDGVLCVAKFKEKTESSSAKRVRKHREQQRLKALQETVTAVTDAVTEARYSNGVTVTGEEEKEKDTEIESLRDNTREAAKKSPAYEFCSWLLGEAIKAGAIPAHHGGDPFRWCYPQVGVAETLLDTYGAEEGRVRAARFIAAKSAQPPRIRRTLTVQALLDVWDWAEIREDGSTQKNTVHKPLSSAAQSTIERLRQREGR